jgi:hypothetical protein
LQRVLAGVLWMKLVRRRASMAMALAVPSWL